MPVKTRIQIYERDREIIKLCCQLGYLTANMLIEAGYFKSRFAAWRRLNKFTEFNFFRTHPRANKKSIILIYYPNAHELNTLVDENTAHYLNKSALFAPWLTKTHHHEDTLRSLAIRLSRNFPDSNFELDFML
jgi:hypothetical protein